MATTAAIVSLIAGDETIILTTKFSQRYALASALLAKAMAEPEQHNFDRARTQAVLTIGASFTGTVRTSTNVQWEASQQLARTVKDIAKEYGFDVE